MKTLDDIVCAIEIEATPERVWTVMTEGGLVEQWLGCMNFKPELGSTFHMQPDGAKRAAGDITGATWCDVTALEPGRRLAFSWYMPGTPKTLVSIDLTPTAGGVRAELTHSGWDRFEPDQIRGIRDMLDGGWRSFVLPQLKRVAEG